MSSYFFSCFVKNFLGVSRDDCWELLHLRRKSKGSWILNKGTLGPRWPSSCRAEKVYVIKTNQNNWKSFKNVLKNSCPPSCFSFSLLALSSRRPQLPVRCAIFQWYKTWLAFSFFLFFLSPLYINRWGKQRPSLPSSQKLHKETGTTIKLLCRFSLSPLIERWSLILAAVLGILFYAHILQAGTR